MGYIWLTIWSMKLSIITVTWNSQAHIKALIQSVQAACTDISFEHYIVDNGSMDDTVAIVRSFGHTHIITNDFNAGFSRANNQALAEATGEYILFLNPDMELSTGSLDTFVSWMDAHTDVGIAGPRLVDADGTLNESARPRRFPRMIDLFAQLIKLPHVFPHILDRYLMRGFDGDREQDVDSVRGACMLVRREVIDTLGWGFDPRYFIWFEDVDICREVWCMGRRVVYTPVISVVDFVGQSFNQRPSVWKQRQFTKSMLQYVQKWEPWYKWIWIGLLRPVGIVIVWMSTTMAKK